MMFSRSNRLVVSLGVYVIWIVITMYAAKFGASSEAHSLNDLVTQGIGLQFVLACLFLIAVIVVFRWHDVGLQTPSPPGSLLVFWFPALYLIAFFTLVLVLGLPPARVIWFVLINTTLVGISEELMFRGILYSGLRTRISIWSAIWLSSILFGAVHVLNVFITGDLPIAVIQAIAASMSGILYIALRIRTSSLIPVIIFHALWDFSIFLMMSVVVTGNAPSVEPGILKQLSFILFVLPLFVYGLFILRNVSHQANSPDDQAYRQKPHALNM